MANRKINGKDLRIKVDANTILHATNCSFQSDMTLEGIATKDTNGQEQSPGDLAWTLTSDSIVVYRDTGTQNDTFALLQSHIEKTLVAIEFTTDDANDIILSGSAYINSVGIGAPVNGFATFNCTFTGSGDLTLDRVSS